MKAMIIPSRVFNDLSAGYGDKEAMRILRSGTRTRRMLLLKAIADTSETARSYLELLAMAAEQNATQVECVLAYPAIEPWAFRCLGGSESVDYIGQLAASAALRTSLPFQLSLPVEKGILVLPTLGTVTDLDAAEATVAGLGKKMIIQCGSLFLDIPSPFDAACPHWRPVPTIEVDAVRLSIEDTDPRRDLFGFEPAEQLSADQLSDFTDRLAEAWRYLETHHPRHVGSMRESLRTIVPLASPAGGGSVSASARGAFGAVAVSVSAPVRSLALQILHEFMHMKLWALQDLVPLHGDGGQAIYFAPWRSDPRTVAALLQGAYAHVGVTDFWRVGRLGAHGARRREADLEFVFWLEQTRVAVAGLLDSGELTAEGIRLVRGLEATLANWAQTEPVPGELRDLASDLITAASVGWRLRNTSPTPQYVTDLVRLRADGKRCPERLAPPSVRAAAAAGWRPSTLERLFRGRYTGRMVGSEDLAHQAFLDGDHVLAMSLYRQVLERDPEREDAWCGLALSLAHTEDTVAATCLANRPDLVRAITCITRDDPLLVAHWLGRS